MKFSKFKKSKFFSSLLTILISFQIYLGSILGYLIFDFFTGKVPSLAFNIESYRVHLHHWLYSLIILIFGLYYNFLPFRKFSAGFLVGAIFHGIYNYPDWHQVIFKP